MIKAISVQSPSFKRLPATANLGEDLKQAQYSSQSKGVYYDNSLSYPGPLSKNIGFGKSYKIPVITDPDTAIPKDGWVIVPSTGTANGNPDISKKIIATLDNLVSCADRYLPCETHYIQNGDFHIYFQDGKPKVCMALVGNDDVLAFYELLGNFTID